MDEQLFWQKYDGTRKVLIVDETYEGDEWDEMVRPPETDTSYYDDNPFNLDIFD
jgi:hypothetical protein